MSYPMSILETIRTGVIVALEDVNVDVSSLPLDTPMNSIFLSNQLNDDGHLAFLDLFIQLTDYFNLVLKDELQSDYTLDFLPEEVFETFSTLEHVFGYFINQYELHKK